MNAIPPAWRLRFEQDVIHVYSLGVRPVCELLAALADRFGDPKPVLDELAAYRSLSPEMVRLVGGDRFPWRLRLVPSP